MKKRLTSLALALCLGASLFTPALAADTSFPDVPDNFWAKSYIDDMAQRGLFIGYEDGTFRPAKEMSAIEAFSLCARLTEDLDSRRQMEEDNAALLDEIFPDQASDWWFRKEAAACLTLGIVDADTLRDINAADGFYDPMEKQVFAMYLVRAMGLEELALSASDQAVDFADAAAIDDAYLPYVHLLAQYGVLTGDENYNFNPESSINRAICSTMLSRALVQVETRGISVEIPRYANYVCVSGYIEDVDVNSDGKRLLTIESPLSGKKVITLTGSETIYLYNMPVSATSLKSGVFARVCYDKTGNVVESIRLTAEAMTRSVTGLVKAYDADSILVGGTRYTINRFTEVSAGGKTGDQSIIDLDAAYETADLTVDYAGNVLHIALFGGTRQVEGILTDVTVTTVGETEKTTITVSAYNGQETTYSVGDSVEILVGDTPVSLKESQEGRQVLLRVADDDLSQLKQVSINLSEKYIQGVLKAKNTKTDPMKVEITVNGDAKKTPYELDEDCLVLYMGAETTLAKLSENTFVTAKVEGGLLTLISAWQGYEDTVGTLTAIDFTTDPIRFEVTLESGSVVKFELPVAELDGVAITSGKSDSDITRLRTGDSVTVTALYHDVTQIDHTHQEANISGTVSALTTRLDGTADITVQISASESATYTASAATTVTKADGTPTNLAAITVGSQVALVAEGSRAVSVQLTAAATVTAQNQLTGTVLTLDTTERTAILLVTVDGTTQPQKVSIPASATLVDTKGTTLRGISSLSVGNVLTLWGSYTTDGTFAASLGIRQ